MRHAHRPVSEIRKCDNRPPADSQHPTQYTQRIARFLQSLAENHVIECALGIIVQAGFQISLIDRYAASDRLLHARARQFDAASIDLLVLPQPGQQLAFAASEIEDACPWFDQLAYDGVVAAAKDFMHR